MRHEIKKPNDKVNKKRNKKKFKKKKNLNVKIKNYKKKILYNNNKKIESNSSLLDWS